MGNLVKNYDIDSNNWGYNLTLITASDFNYLPGVYALFNSAVMNGFQGQLKLLLSQDVDPNLVCQHPQMSVINYQPFDGIYHLNIGRLKGLLSLPPGNYLHLDADIIIERPCSHILEPIETSLLVSIDPHPKYDPYDVWVYHQCKTIGISFEDLPNYLYVNGGFLGFSLPRDEAFIHEWCELSRIYFQGINRVFGHPYFHFIDQDMLNLLIRKQLGKGKSIVSISPKNIEFSNSDILQDRPFPYTNQKNLPTADHIKYIIHGASLPRPWLQPKPAKSLKARLLNFIKTSGVGALYRKRLPYERAWAYYTCSEDRPIPISAWAERHSFTAYKNWSWRKAYGLGELT